MIAHCRSLFVLGLEAQVDYSLLNCWYMAFFAHYPLFPKSRNVDQLILITYLITFASLGLSSNSECHQARCTRVFTLFSSKRVALCKCCHTYPDKKTD